MHPVNISHVALNPHLPVRRRGGGAWVPRPTRWMRCWAVPCEPILQRWTRPTRVGPSAACNPIPCTLTSPSGSLWGGEACCQRSHRCHGLSGYPRNGARREFPGTALGTGAELAGPLLLAQLKPCRCGPSALPLAALMMRCPRLDRLPGCWLGGPPAPPRQATDLRRHPAPADSPWAPLMVWFPPSRRGSHPTAFNQGALRTCEDGS